MLNKHWRTGKKNLWSVWNWHWLSKWKCNMWTQNGNGSKFCFTVLIFCSNMINRTWTWFLTYDFIAYDILPIGQNLLVKYFTSNLEQENKIMEWDQIWDPISMLPKKIKMFSKNSFLLGIIRNVSHADQLLQINTIQYNTIGCTNIFFLVEVEDLF